MTRRSLGLLACLATLAAGPTALATEILGPNPSECEIQAALIGRTASSCPPVSLRRPPPDTFNQPNQPNPPAPALSPLTRPTIPPMPDSPDVRLSGNFRIQFDFNAATIRAESRPVLDQIGSVLAATENAALHFEIVGHTDAIGSASANLRLSQRRAQAVVAYLIERHGIAANRLRAVGMGSRQPLFPDNPKAAANRRVEIINLGARPG